MRENSIPEQLEIPIEEYEKDLQFYDRFELIDDIYRRIEDYKILVKNHKNSLWFYPGTIAWMRIQ